jgi:hypothetical protein
MAVVWRCRNAFSSSRTRGRPRLWRILYTIVENCRRLGIDTREYLEDVLTRLPGMKASEAVHLTPAKGLLESIFLM